MFLIDFIWYNKIIFELKAVKEIAPEQLRG